MHHPKRLAALALFALFLHAHVRADPTPGIEKLISTPASSFDVFLYKLYVGANGPSFFGGSKMQEPVHIISIDYDYGSNIINMTFHIDLDHKLMKGFNSQAIDSKKTTLTRAARDLSESLGVEYRDKDKKLRIGLIQMTEIRYGWATKDIDQNSIRNEIANRTVVELLYPGDEKTLYTVRRSLTGRYEFSADPK